METKIQKWGNSLALRIPKAFAQDINIDQDTPVSLTLEAGSLVITPIKDREFNLDYLLSQVTDENIHQEIDTGKLAGKEFW